MDALDYTPAQALADASAAAQTNDYDGAIIILVNDGAGDGEEIDLTHFISGIRGARLVSLLEVIKTKFSLQLLGLYPQA